MSTGGEVANALVCKTSIRRFNPDPVLQLPGPPDRRAFVLAALRLRMPAQTGTECSVCGQLQRSYAPAQRHGPCFRPVALYDRRCPGWLKTCSYICVTRTPPSPLQASHAVSRRCTEDAAIRHPSHHGLVCDPGSNLCWCSNSAAGHQCGTLQVLATANLDHSLGVP